MNEIRQEIAGATCGRSEEGCSAKNLMGKLDGGRLLLEHLRRSELHCRRRGISQKMAV